MTTEIRVPTLGESVSEATVAKWLKNVGDAVAVDDPLVELETDKVTLEVNAQAAGTLSEILVQAGENVAVGALLGMIGAAGAASAKKAAPAPVVAAAAAPAAAPVAAKAERALAPSVQKIVTEKGLDPAAITGTGKDGRLIKGDVLAAVAAPAPAPAAAPTPSGPRANAVREERVRMTRLRKRIAGTPARASIG